MNNSNQFDVVGRILDTMDQLHDIINNDNDSENTQKAEVPVNGDKSPAQVVRSDEPTPPGNEEVPSMAQLTKSLCDLASSLKTVQANQKEMVDVMMAAGAQPFFEKASPACPKNKGKGKRSKPPKEDLPPPREPTIPSRRQPRCEDNAPPPKKKRREEMFELNARDSELDYSDREGSEDEIAFTSDEVELQIDEFLKTAEHASFKPKGKPLISITPPKEKPSTSRAQSSRHSVSEERDEPIVLPDEWLDEGLASFAQDLATDEDVGPPVNKQLAEIFTNLLSKKLADDKVKQRIDENPPPNNIPLLHPPRVNECIWELMKAAPRSTDIRMRKIQVRLTRGLVAIARLADSILEHKRKGTNPDLGTCLNTILHSFALIGNANYEISLRRRETLRSQLNPKYSRLCYPSTPVTADLFGDDVTKLVEDITKVQRLGASIAGGYSGGYRGGHHGHNSNGYRGRGNNRQRGGFRGNGRCLFYMI